jgi:LDH2 family malate/lactate/ureidoglycolate dehydrogenase
MPRYAAADLIQFAAALLEAAGMSDEQSPVVAEVLVEADLMGHDTHGLQLLPSYMRELEDGSMLGRGEPDIVADKGAVVVWDGKRLSGVWLTARALDLASRRAQTFGMGAVSIGHSHHIACLQAYLPRITGRNQIALITCSDPCMASVAPYGGLDAAFTPNPIACGIPTGDDPILIDMSASITTNGMTSRLAALGQRFPGQWALDHNGTPTDDPNVLNAEQPGTLLPAGGTDHGHKGYGLALIVEALTQGLSGYGRSSKPDQWGSATFVQVMDPAVFAGHAAFTTETDDMALRCRAARPAPGFDAVRLPGERALVRKRAALSAGLELFDGIMERLQKEADLYGIEAPAPK